MAALPAVISCDIVDGQDEFHALSGPGAYYDYAYDYDCAADDDVDGPATDDNADILVTTPPVHPVRSLQGAFEESYYESTRDSIQQLGSGGSGVAVVLGGDDYEIYNDPEMRRRQLLEAECYEDGWVTKWKPRRGAKYHPYLKLIAQIVFGMHLLEQEQAKSNAEVVRILQHHVDDVDAFLERTWEDFDLANKDIEERIRFLKMPMNHTEVFEKMLDEKKFRTELLKGNEKLEKIVDRTTKAMNSALSDIQAGITSTEELSVYLSGVKRRWPMDNIEIADVLSAMKGNEQGWMAYLRDLQRKGSALGKNLNVLNTIVAEIAKQAAAASRRNKPQRTVSPTKTSSPGVRSKFTRDSPKKMGAWTNKPLPQEPKPRLTISKPIPLPSTGNEKSQLNAATTIAASSRPIKEEDGSPPRPKTAGYAGGGGGVPRPTQSEDMRELAAFLRQSGPLRSHPPDQPAKETLLPTRTASLSKLRGDSEAVVIHSTRKPNRTQSQGGNELLNFHPSMNKANPQFRRSVSQSAVPTLGRTPSKTISKRSITSPKIFQSSSPQLESRPSTSTGFSRRVSKRLKTLPQSPIFSPKPDMSPRPIDSAFSNHIAEKDISSDIPTTTTIKQGGAALAADEMESKPTTPNSKRPASRLGLFPKTTGPMTPSQASDRSYSISQQQQQQQDSSSSPRTFNTTTTSAATMTLGDSPRKQQQQQHTAHSSKSSVSMSLRNFFHRRGLSQSVF